MSRKSPLEHPMNIRLRPSVRMNVGTPASLSKASLELAQPLALLSGVGRTGRKSRARRATEDAGKASEQGGEERERIWNDRKERKKGMSGQEQWSPEVQEAVWEKGSPVEALDPDEYRMDAAGALMQRDAYGKKHRFGWFIDEIAPKEGEETDVSLLRPLFWKNRAARQELPPRKFYRYQSALELNVNHFFAPDI